MFSILSKIKNRRANVSSEYARVNANPIAKSIIQTAVMLVDMLIMFVLIWHVFAYCIPAGSWINIVDGNSMSPTMHSGQIIFTDTSEIGRGDVVTAYLPEHIIQNNPKYKGMILVKRIVGVPGDRIVINEDGVYVNDKLLDETYLTDETKKYTYKENGCNSVLLDANEYFLMGDNREVSYDSRAFGVVNRSNILYKQSAEPTVNFYLKLIFVFIVFALNLCMYGLVEFVLTECAYWLIFGRNDKRKESGGDNAALKTTSETVILKGDTK